MSEVTLYDLASKDGNACWSLNPWKTRLALNYKGIPYTTEWLEYPAVAPTLKSLEIPPNAEGTPYTIPAVRFSDGTAVMESRKIAEEFDKRFPKPSLHLDTPELPQIEASLLSGAGCLLGVLIPKVPRSFLNPESSDYFHRTREERFGMQLSEVEQKTGGESAWKGAEPSLKEMGDLLKKKGGPFVLGEEVSHADFMIVGMLEFAKRIDVAIFDRLLSTEPALGKLYDASKPWLERDDH